LDQIHEGFELAVALTREGGGGDASAKIQHQRSSVRLWTQGNIGEGDAHVGVPWGRKTSARRKVMDVASVAFKPKPRETRGRGGGGGLGHVGKGWGGSLAGDSGRQVADTGPEAVSVGGAGRRAVRWHGR
jgi:hypothetical protein